MTDAVAQPVVYSISQPSHNVWQMTIFTGLEWPIQVVGNLPESEARDALLEWARNLLGDDVKLIEKRRDQVVTLQLDRSAEALPPSSD